MTPIRTVMSFMAVPRIVPGEILIVENAIDLGRMVGAALLWGDWTRDHGRYWTVDAEIMRNARIDLEHITFQGKPVPMAYNRETSRFEIHPPTAQDIEWAILSRRRVNSSRLFI